MHCDVTKKPFERLREISILAHGKRSMHACSISVNFSSHNLHSTKHVKNLLKGLVEREVFSLKPCIVFIFISFPFIVLLECEALGESLNCTLRNQTLAI